MQPKGLHFTPCSYANDEITAGGSIALDFVGKRNTTRKPYTSPKYYWSATPQPQDQMALRKPRYVLLSTTVDYQYSVILGSSGSEH
jgi:hypothetical protein